VEATGGKTGCLYPSATRARKQIKEREGTHAAAEASEDGALKAQLKSCGIMLQNSTAHAIERSSRESLGQ
jgi:hypothetical protein